MLSAGLSARELTERLIARVDVQAGAPDGSVIAAQAAFKRAYRELVRSLGSIGSRAILSRALVQAQAEHHVLREIHVDGEGVPLFDSLPALTDARHASEVAAGLEAWLEGVLGLLGQLIGVDMVARLVESAAPEVNKNLDAQ